MSLNILESSNLTHDFLCLSFTNLQMFMTLLLCSQLFYCLYSPINNVNICGGSPENYIIGLFLRDLGVLLDIYELQLEIT